MPKTKTWLIFVKEVVFNRDICTKLLLKILLFWIMIDNSCFYILNMYPSERQVFIWIFYRI